MSAVEEPPEHIKVIIQEFLDLFGGENFCRRDHHASERDDWGGRHPAKDCSLACRRGSEFIVAHALAASLSQLCVAAGAVVVACLRGVARGPQPRPGGDGCLD